jgi:pimeloyl-ACP methyl ester carboxylesterase
MIKFTCTFCPECFCSIIDLACNYGPGIRQNTWAHFDYFPRTERNMMAYNQPTPPSYEPAQIPATIPVLIILGGQDWTAPPHGINMFMTQLQQVPHVVNLTKYAHYDLIFSATRENDVYLPILSFLESSLFA